MFKKGFYPNATYWLIPTCFSSAESFKIRGDSCLKHKNDRNNMKFFSLRHGSLLERQQLVVGSLIFRLSRWAGPVRTAPTLFILHLKLICCPLNLPSVANNNSLQLKLSDSKLCLVEESSWMYLVSALQVPAERKSGSEWTRGASCKM